MTDPRPNFLMISTDQQRADHLGCYGARILQTPNIDGLALRGTRFTNAYVASPVCMPNRASLITGRMPSLHGVRHNGLNLDLGTLTFAEVLRQAGWHTSLSGKPHFQCVTQSPAMMNLGADRAALPEARQQTPGRYNQEIGELWHEGSAREIATPYYGFDEVDLAVGHGDQVDGHYSGWAKDQGVDIAKSRGPENAISETRSAMFQAWRTAVSEEHYPTRYIETKTIERLQAYALNPKTPFFHWASFCDPHHPFTPPGKYWNMYDPDDVEIPASFKASHDSELVAKLHALRRSGKANLKGTSAVAVDEAELRVALALTYGMIAMIDDAVGSILQTLRAEGLAENTIVIFLSDHGDLMGEHGLIFKGPYHYQGLIRTPLIWADPRCPSADIVETPVSAIDVSATILEAAGLAPFNGMQGQKFIDRQGNSSATRENLLIEDEIQSEIPGKAVRGRVRTLISNGFRLSVYDRLSDGEFYDLNNDPHELRNLWSEANYAQTRSELIEKLLREMISHSETSPNPHFAA